MIQNIKIGVSAVDGTVHLYRHGKDPGLALEQRAAEGDLFAALVAHLFFNTEEKTAVREFTLGGHTYRVKLEIGLDEDDRSDLPKPLAAGDEKNGGGQ